MIRIARDEFPAPLRTIGLSLAAWTSVAALFFLQRLYAFAAKGVAPMWDHVVLEATIVWGTWALLTPLIFVIVQRLPLPSEHPRRVLLHAPIGILVGLFHSLLVAAITPLFIWRPSFAPIRDMFAGRLTSAVASETLIYFLVAAVLYASIYATESRHLSLLLQELRRDPAIDSLAVPTHDGVLKVPLDSIDWVQAEDNYVRVHTGGRSYLVRATLTAVETRLASKDFIRIHRSAIVSRSRISGLRRLGSDRYLVLLTNGVQLRVSRAYSKRIAAAVGAPLTPR